MDPALIPTLGGTVGLLSVAGWLVISFMRENKDLRKAWRDEIDSLKRDNQAQKAETLAQKAENLACVIQVNGLIGVLQRNGIAVPDSLLRGVPDAAN